MQVDGSSTEMEGEFQHLARYERFRDNDVFVASILTGNPLAREDLFQPIAHYRVVWRFPFGPGALLGIWTGPGLDVVWSLLLSHPHQMLLPFRFSIASSRQQAIEYFERYRDFEDIPREYTVKFIYARDLSSYEIQHWRGAEHWRPRYHESFGRWRIRTFEYHRLSPDVRDPL